MSKQLIFVYKADSGLFNTLTDMAHKLISPQTYECRLCALTHGVFSMHREWRTFLEQLPFELEFLHRDEFARRYPNQSCELPAVLMSGADGMETVLSATELAGLESLEQLQRILLKKLS